jgi:hypothetical protein
MHVSIVRLNEFTRAAVLKYEPEGVTEEERPAWEAIGVRCATTPASPTARCGTASWQPVRQQRP